MVKKLKAKTATKPTDSQLAAAVKESAQQIWLAGLGAFAKAQDGGAKVFENLVRQGVSIQKRTMKVTEDKVNEVTTTVTKAANRIQKQATGSWDKLESVFEQRVERAMTRLGVPTSKEVDALTKRVEQLTASVQTLTHKAAKPAAVQPATKKSAAKKVVKAAKKPAAKKAVKAAPVAAATQTPAAPTA